MLSPYRTPSPPIVQREPALRRAWRRARPWLVYFAQWTFIILVVLLTVPIRIAQGRGPFDC